MRFLIILFACLTSCTQIEDNISLGNVDFLIIDDCQYSNDVPDEVISPTTIKLISPIIEDGGEVNWFKNGIALSDQTNLTLSIPELSSSEIHEYRLSYKSNDGTIVEKVRTLKVLPPLDKVEIYSLTLSIKGLPKFIYDNKLDDTTGRADIVPMIFDLNNNLLGVSKSYVQNLGDCRDISFDLKQPIVNWNIKNPIIVKIFDYDPENESFQEITEDGFNQIIEFDKEKYWNGDCEKRYPSAVVKNWISPDTYGCNQGLGVAIKILWKK